MKGCEHAHSRGVLAALSQLKEMGGRIVQKEAEHEMGDKGVEFGHHGKECSFYVLVKKHELTSDPAIVLLAKIVNGANTDNSLWNQPEAKLAESR